MRWYCVAPLAAALAMATAPIDAADSGAAGERLRNWFGDPFFPIAHGLADCPPPLGPMLTVAQRNAEAHGRVERGTSCYLSGACTRPNSYLYDADIAQAVRARMAAHPAFAGESLWVTVQRRFITVEGCVTDSKTVTDIENFMRDLPDVERVVVSARIGPHARVPYRVAPP